MPRIFSYLFLLTLTFWAGLNVMTTLGLVILPQFCHRCNYINIQKTPHPRPIKVHVQKTLAFAIEEQERMPLETYFAECVLSHLSHLAEISILNVLRQAWLCRCNFNLKLPFRHVSVLRGSQFC